MKAVCFVIFLTFSSLLSHAQELNFKNGTIYIVRHGEKQSGDNPALTSDGHLRSGQLASLFNKKYKKPQRIYVNKYKRIQQTADSVRLYFNVDTSHYAVDLKGDGLVNAINKNTDKRILVVGHSNTVPALIRRLGIKDFPSADLPDHEFDNFYIIKYKKGRATLIQRKYGKLSVK